MKKRMKTLKVYGVFNFVLLFVSVLAIYGCGGGSTSNPGSLSGKVTLEGVDNYSGAKIDVQGASLSTMSSSDGAYSISSISSGTYTVTASKDLYDSKSQSAVVGSGSTLTGVDFTLKFTQSPNVPQSGTLTSISVSCASSSVTAGQTTQCSATGTYSDGTTSSLTSSVTWTSSSTSVGTISSSGLFTAVAAGTTNITAAKDSVTSSAVAITVSQSSSALPGKYLMVFCACDTATKDCKQNPNDYSYLAYSDDGASWQLVSGFSGFQGSVPDIVKRGNTLYIYTPDPDKVTRYNITTGVVDSKNISIKQADGSADDLGDVSPYLDPATNKIVLFYKTTAGFSGDPQFCTTCSERSATEVDGSDGAQFLTDSGERLSTSVQPKFGDADIFYDGSKYILYIGENANTSTPGAKNKTIVYTSTTLKGSYTAVSTLPSGVLTESGSVPQGYYDSATQKYWTYITVLSPSAPAIIKRAIHSDFSKQLTDADFTTVLTGTNFSIFGSAYTLEGPGFAVNN